MNVNSSGASILHQPVHIATPAPSPPPSPPVGGKAGKKQNYQTNQNFPFMYPPLDSTSNSAGGKGAAGLQELLVGRKWEGSDIPKSIIEAGALFAKRMRMTRAMRQLWNEREKFLKYERGWDCVDEYDDIEELDLDTILGKKAALEGMKPIKPDVDYGPNADVGDDVKKKLDLVEQFYVSSSFLIIELGSDQAAKLYTSSPIPGYCSAQSSTCKCDCPNHTTDGAATRLGIWFQVRCQSSRKWSPGPE